MGYLFQFTPAVKLVRSPVVYELTVGNVNINDLDKVSSSKILLQMDFSSSLIT